MEIASLWRFISPFAAFAAAAFAAAAASLLAAQGPTKPGGYRLWQSQRGM